MTLREKIIAIVMAVVIVVAVGVYLPKLFKNKELRLDDKISGEAVSENEYDSDETLMSTVQAKLDRITMRMSAATLEQQVDAVWDPFKIPEGLARAKRISDIDLTDLTFMGIMWDKGQPLAIINEEVFRVGDTLYGFTIVQIKSNEVILMKEEKTFTLQLFPKGKYEQTENIFINETQKSQFDVHE